MKSIIALFAILAAGFLPQLASAYPLPKGSKLMTVMPKSLTANYNFEGIIELSNCSGALVKLETSRDSDRAMVLTNGHCLESGMPNPGVVIVGRSSSRRFTLLNAQGRSAGQVRADLIIYSTMTKTDMTLYRLTETYEQIMARTRIPALVMSPRRPDVGQPLEIISGYWKRGYSCNIDGFAYQLKESGWTCEDSIRFTQPGCETIGGTSGSPVVAAGTRTVIGVNNTGNEDGGRCGMNNPCEVDQQGNVTYKMGNAYGQQTYWVYSCMNSMNELDLNKEGCLLAK